MSPRSLFLHRPLCAQRDAVEHGDAVAALENFVKGGLVDRGDVFKDIYLPRKAAAPQLFEKAEIEQHIGYELLAEGDLRHRAAVAQVELFLRYPGEKQQRGHGNGALFALKGGGDEALAAAVLVVHADDGAGVLYVRLVRYAAALVMQGRAA